MAKINVIPLRDYVLIKPIVADKKTDSGIYLPETASQEKPQEGKVVAVGTSEKISVKKNQKVIFSRYSGTEIAVDGSEYLLVKNDDVLAIVEA
ncbi:MAG: co-chaperone GroES [Candidatus Moranbacteria bacterium]|nr:co-chaperone GroES [Candidatus Moranbacteria bacterium]